MAAPYGKRPAKWLELPSTISFLNALSSIRKSDTSDSQVVITKMGSPETGGGTWFHELAAIKFAEWLTLMGRCACLSSKESHNLTFYCSPHGLQVDVKIPSMGSLQEKISFTGELA